MLDMILETAAAKKAMDLFGDRLIGAWRNRKEARETLEFSKRRILSARIANSYYPELTRLREVFIRYGMAERSEENRRFFEKWLSHPAVEMGWAPNGCWTRASIETLYADLETIRA